MGVSVSIGEERREMAFFLGCQLCMMEGNVLLMHMIEVANLFSGGFISDD